MRLGAADEGQVDGLRRNEVGDETPGTGDEAMVFPA
jgi:hypothetical protein